MSRIRPYSLKFRRILGVRRCRRLPKLVRLNANQKILAQSVGDPDPSAMACTLAERAASKRFAPNEVVFGLGDLAAPAFLVVSGLSTCFDVFRRAGLGNEQKITGHDEGSISGGIAQLAGRPTLVEGRAGPGGCEAISFAAAICAG